VGLCAGPRHAQAQRRAGGDDEAMAAEDADPVAAEAAAALERLLAEQTGAAETEPPDLETLARAASGDPAATAGSRVELDLADFERLRRAVEARRAAGAPPTDPPIVFGSARYEGEERGGALALTETLRVELGRPGRWKAVPIVGADAVLVGARVDGEPVATSVRHGYHVWLTQRTGPVTVVADLLIPSSGPRGSIEYGFVTVRTPVTNFACRFATAGLEPRLDGVVRADVRSEEGATVLEATLRPTVRVHLVGFRDFAALDGAGEGQAARVFAETSGLLSVDEGRLELFAVVRYTILYAGAKHFELALPPGLTVVAADGEGAFRWTLEERDGVAVLVGETAFPIRNAYELSVRLARDLPAADAEAAAREGETFPAPLVRCLGVERQGGWLAVEVPGKLRLEEVERGDSVAVDVRQLPTEMLDSAVSPILHAYRYHAGAAGGADAALRGPRFRAVRLPSIEPDGGSVDHVRAFTVVSPEGGELTELRVKLRNRVRHALALGLPPDVEVRSVLVEGQPAKASRDAAGNLLLPLVRSKGGRQLTPFTLSVVIERRGEPLGLAGAGTLTLPSFDLPVSSLSWSVFLPGRNLYGRLRGDGEPQPLAGHASWLPPPQSGRADADGDRRGGGSGRPDGALAAAAPAGTGSAESGEMPVRITSPRTGTRLEHERYWLERGVPVEVTFRYARRWLRLPSLAIAALLLALGAFVAARPPRRGPRRLWRLAGALAAVGVAWALLRWSGGRVVVAAAALGLLAALAVALAAALRRTPLRARLGAWTGAVREHLRAWRAAAPPEGEGRLQRWARRAWALGLAGALSVALALTLLSAWGLVRALVGGE
jgi:hypothetical protein